MTIEPPSPSRLDLTRLSINEIAKSLRLLAEQILSDLLASLPTKSLNDYLAQSYLLNLADVQIPEAAATRPRTGRRWPWTARRQAIPRPAVPPSIREKSPSWASLAARATDGYLNDQGWRIQAEQQLANQLFPVQPPLLPIMFWEIAGDSAWLDLDFQKSAAEQVRAVLSTRYLFSIKGRWTIVSSQAEKPPAGKDVGANPVARFSPRTFWSLIALLPCTPTLASGPAAEFEKRRQAAVGLQNMARMQVIFPGWANFWDQWLVKEFFTWWQPKEEPNNTAIYHSLLKLPYLQTARPGAPLQSPDQTGTDTEIDLAHPDWEAERPLWMIEFNSGEAYV